MTHKEITLEVLSDPSLLATIRATVRAYIAELGLEKQRADEVVLAVDEACTNVIRHAYEGCHDKTYRLSMQSTADWIEFELRDAGKCAADGDVTRKEREETIDKESVTPGGLGVQFIFQTCDSVDFTPGEYGGNCLTMKVKRPRGDA